MWYMPPGNDDFQERHLFQLCFAFFINSKHSDEYEEELEKAYKILYVEFEKLRETRKQYMVARQTLRGF